MLKKCKDFLVGIKVVCSWPRDPRRVLRISIVFDWVCNQDSNDSKCASLERDFQFQATDYFSNFKPCSNNNPFTYFLGSSIEIKTRTWRERIWLGGSSSEDDWRQERSRRENHQREKCFARSFWYRIIRSH